MLKRMSVADDITIYKVRANVLAGMREFMEESLEEGDEPGYDDSHVATCDAIVEKFLRDVDAAADHVAGRAAVKEAVLALNALNAACEGALIETDQREQLGEILIRAGALRGFNGDSEDITEEWREW